MATKVHELLSFCWKHGYKVDIIPVANYEVRLDVITPRERIAGKRTFNKRPRNKKDIGYNDKIIEIYKQLKKDIVQELSSKKQLHHGTRKI